MKTIKTLVIIFIFIVFSNTVILSEEIIITSAEYSIDTYPEEGNTIPMNAKDGSFDQQTELTEAVINTSNLSVGPHTVYVRMKDSDGNWGIRKAGNFFVKASNNRKISGAEYFVNTDPGRGNGTAISALDGSFDSSKEKVQLSLSTQGFSMGSYNFFIRMKDSAGNWGPARSISFTVGNTTEPSLIYISNSEFFVDNDPGEGKGTSLSPLDSLFDSNTEEVESEYNTSNLSIGDHFIYVRFQDAKGLWGAPDSNLLTISGAGLSDEMNSNITNKYFLSHNYPNPFNPLTTIKFDIKEKCNVKLTIYNQQGRKVSCLVNTEYMPGKYEVTFNGNELPSGIYFYKLQAGEYTAVKKMILIK